MKKKALVIGSHVSKSLSPLIFNYWFNKYNIDGEYFFKEINTFNFEREINGILEDRCLVGFNITIPYKEIINKNILNLDDHAKQIGAINCVSKVNNNWIGKNTDWEGFYKSVEPKIDKKNLNKALVIGYGGASKAILYALEKMGLKKIFVYNRTMNKTENINSENNIFVISYEEIYQDLEVYDLIINTTPVNVLKEPLNNTKNFFGFDIVYKPKETDFLSHFKKKKRIYGISMLVNQAIPCFEEWFGVRPEADNKLFKILEKEIVK